VPIKTAKAMLSKAAMTMTSKPAEGAKEPPRILRSSPVAYGFHFYTRRFAPPNKYIVAPDSHLQGAPEKSRSYNGSFGPFGKAHIGKPFAYFLAD